MSEHETLVNGKNYFNEASFDEACKALEKGATVKMYIDCIGHTRNNNEQEVYKEALSEKYGDRLLIEKSDGGFSYSYSYGLKTGGKDN